ncbi:isoprenyl transferase [Boudabousia liubingyangii]|uniref:Isoprenyl transferase n=1 Tax=Boudabousia liubingyangii TaxID=1921764 RepID=A0A1Q5PJU8_9ACTO|nr:isoprenyl transferase [Boudabousia liubingyangii]OKL46205.1 isoprenyl transferase [Boudabousia liubingyangii]OKL46354.1 isoprenyl transferase [Boudabousia liubingyangii]
MAFQSLLYDAYERRLLREITNQGVIPRHIGVILDGNRRWAKAAGFDTASGHREGARKIIEFLGWAESVDVEVVTLWMLSTDNLERDPKELKALLGIIVDSVKKMAGSKRWRLQLVGDTSALPVEVAEELAKATDSTADLKGLQVNVAVGYGGRQEIAQAVRRLLARRLEAGQDLAQAAAEVSEAEITANLYTSGQPDPDLVIRTSGEQRLSGFLLWQSAHSEFYFCEAYWPDMRRVDFLRALRDYSQRERRMGR